MILQTSTSGFVVSCTHNSDASPMVHDLSVISSSILGMSTLSQLKIFAGALMTVCVVCSWQLLKHANNLPSKHSGGSTQWYNHVCDGMYQPRFAFAL